MTDPAADLRTHTPRDPAWEEKVRTSFARQPAMTLIRARLARVAPGEAEVAVDAHAELTQQHGFLHGGITGMLLDTACGFAGLSLLAPGAGILTVEYKMNFLSPGIGERFVARARVRKSGRTLSLVEADAIAWRDGRELTIATMTATMMAVHGRDDVRN